MRKLLTALLLTINFFVANGQVTNKEYKNVVQEFIDCIKNKKKEAVALKMSFPFNRQYPIPPIKNKQEFIERYTEVFDDSLTGMIAKSRPATDWSEMGWRGIMLFQGTVWLDYDGRLISVNYQSDFERKKCEALIAKEKAEIHSSLKKFKIPVCVLETTKFRIRIDDLGEGNYRYASWPVNQKMSESPEVILESGKYIAEGSGDNHRYEFKNKEYTYQCSINVVREDSFPPASLTVSKGGKVILSQNAQIK
jgi:hypothetical protein